MDNFITTIIFVLPGLLCYYWLQWLGFVPSQKHNVFEMAGISTLLWIPVSGMSLLAYDIVAIMINLDIENGHINSYFKIPIVLTLTELNNLLSNLWFILYFIISSIFFSYFFAKLWTTRIFNKFLKHVNKIRTEKLKIGALSKKPTVWEEIFIIEGKKVVKISKIDKPEEFVIGGIRKTSRPLEPERHITLDDVDYFTKLIEKYNPIIKHVFIDTKAGISVYVYHEKSIYEAQYNDIYSSNPIVSFSYPEEEDEKEEKSS